MTRLLVFGFLAIGFWNTSADADDGASRTQASENWPQWRGPLGTGVAPLADPPVQWSETENIRWKTALPGSGHSTPVVWGDRVFVTAAVPFGESLEPRYSGAPGAHDNLPVTQRQDFVVLAVSRETGKILWQQSLHRDLPHEGAHYTASLASASPATDGERVFAHFVSYGLYCLDRDGNLQWKRDFGRMQTKHGHGEGSSPALYGDTLVVNWDHEGPSFVVALDKRTGQERWKIDRSEVTSWATPLIVDFAGKPQVIISGTSRVRGYDLSDGRVIWECGGLSANIVASPVSADGMVYVGSSYDTRAMLGIQLDGAKGDITDTGKVIWTRQQRTPYVPSPLLYGDSLYFLRHYQGILSRVHAPTGEERTGPFRLGSIRNVYSSPIGAANRVYVTDLEGTTLVFAHNEIPRVLARNKLEDSFAASAAAVGGELYLRGRQYLYCIAKSIAATGE